MTRVSGKVAVKETLNGIGYIQQDPWLQQGKIQSYLITKVFFQKYLFYNYFLSEFYIYYIYFN